MSRSIDTVEKARQAGATEADIQLCWLWLAYVLGPGHPRARNLLRWYGADPITVWRSRNSEEFGRMLGGGARQQERLRDTEQALAVCQRLHALGYLAEPSDVLDTRALGALRRFQQDVGLETRILADTDTLRALDTACTRAASRGHMIDDVYYKALDLCRAAAEQPLRYKTQANGSTRAA